MEKGKESRVAIVGEIKRKRKSSAVKKSKRKYRRLEAAKRSAAFGENEHDADEALRARAVRQSSGVLNPSA